MLLKETDYRKWLVFNGNNKDKQWMKDLASTLTSRRDSGQFHMGAERHGEQVYYRISEEENVDYLFLTDESLKQMALYLHEHYIKDEVKEGTSIPQKETRQEAEKKVVPEKNFRPREYQISIRHSNSTRFEAVLGKISFSNKTLHALLYGAIGFLFLQPVIIISNFKLFEMGKFWEYAGFLPIPLACYFCVRSYSIRHRDLRRYWDIFKVNMPCCLFIGIFISIEVYLIDIYQLGDSSLVVLVGFMFIISLAMGIVGLFINAIVYFLRGGKWVEVR